MKHLAPSIFRAFACAGGSCPDSCCRAGWEIIPDEETLKLYETLPGEAGERIHAGIVLPKAFPLRGRWHLASHGSPMTDEVDSQTSEPIEPLLRQNEHRVCVLLDPDGLCHVQKHFGHEALCRVCREYPRFHREFGNLTEHGISLSCPTAYALAIQAPLQWETWEDEAPVVPNDLAPDAYLRLRRGRELALDLLSRENLPLWKRIALVRRLAAAMQNAPEQLVRHDYALRLRRWGLGIKEQGAGSKARRGRRPRRPVGIRTQNLGIRGRRDGTLPSARHTIGAVTFHPAFALAHLAERFAGLEILSPAWWEKLERFRTLLRNGAGAHLSDGPNMQAETQHIWLPELMQSSAPLQTDQPEIYARYLAYSLYKYWLDALDDGDLIGRVERSISMTLLGLAMDHAFPDEGPHLQRISREIEHCEENLGALLSR